MDVLINTNNINMLKKLEHRVLQISVLVFYIKDRIDPKFKRKCLK